MVTFVDDRGRFCTLPGSAVDESEGGLGLVLSCPLDVGSSVRIEIVGKPVPVAAPVSRDAFVRWCKRLNDKEFLLGVINADSCSWNRNTAAPPEFDEDLYEILQVNMNADADTIHRVFRILATRYHPDNQETGDAARFHRLVAAYETLRDPERRAAFDVWQRQDAGRQRKMFESSNVTSGPAAEKRKRAGLLQALYTKRLMEPEQPALTLRDMEALLGCPREHLEFSIWYLRENGHIARSDNSKFQITAKGVDLAESVADDQRALRVPLQITSSV